MIRVRLFFDPGNPNLGSFASIRVKKCWMMLNLNTCKIVKDFEEVIRRRFFENEEVKLSLSIDDFTLPPDESIKIIRENEIIRVEVSDDSTNIERLQHKIQNTDSEESSKYERKKKKQKKEKEVAPKTETMRSDVLKSSKRKKQKVSDTDAGDEEVCKEHKESDSGTPTEKKKKKKHKKSQEFKDKSTNQNRDQPTTENVPETSSKKKKNKQKEFHSAGNCTKDASVSGIDSSKEKSTIKKTKSSRHTEKERSRHGTPTCTDKEIKIGGYKPKTDSSSSSTDGIGVTNAAKKNTTKRVEQNQKGKTANTPVGQRLLEISQVSKVNLNPQSEGKSKGHIRFSSSDESSSDSDSSSESSSSAEEQVTKKAPSSAVTRTPIQYIAPSTDVSVSSSVTPQLVTSPNSVSNIVNGKKSLQSDANPSSNEGSVKLNGMQGGESDIARRNEDRGSWTRRTPQQSGRGRSRRIGQVENPFSKVAQLNSQLSNKSVVIQNPVDIDEHDKPVDSTTNLDTPSTEPDCETLPIGPEKPAPEPKDYTPYPPLIGPPRAGDKIAYKILELSNLYCPEVSEYKEAEVVKYSPDSGTIEAKLSTEHVPAAKRQGRFELHYEDDDENDGSEKRNEPISDMVSFQLSSLIEPKLL